MILQEREKIMPFLESATLLTCAPDARIIRQRSGLQL